MSTNCILFQLFGLYGFSFQVVTPAVFALESPVNLDFGEIQHAFTQKEIVSFSPSVFDPSSSHESKVDSVGHDALTSLQLDALEAKIREAVNTRQNHLEQQSAADSSHLNGLSHHRK